MKRKSWELLGFCGVYCGACTTYRAYNDNDQALVEWEIRTGMPKEEIVCKGCRSGLVNSVRACGKKLHWYAEKCPK